MRGWPRWGKHMQTLEQLARNLVPYLKPYFVSLDTTPVYVGARVYNSSVVTVGNAAMTAVTFSAARWDTDGLWSSGNPSRLTCTRAGVYAMSGHVLFAVNGKGVRDARLVLNGTTPLAIQFSVPQASLDHAVSVSTIYQLAVGDYVQLQVYQTSGGALNIKSGGSYSPELVMHRLA